MEYCRAPSRILFWTDLSGECFFNCSTHRSMLCPNLRCGSQIHADEEKCSTCGTFAGYPNVRAADHPDEVAALEARYRDERSSAAAEGRLAALDAFEQRLTNSSAAVVNVDFLFLYPFLARPGALYSTYDYGVEAEFRMPAEPENDRDRRRAGTRLFGRYAKDIRYAALSLDGAGLSSYGPFALRLRDVAIELRASLLEENSYDFVDRYGTRGPLPPGFRCSWGNRHLLAVAKLGTELLPGTSESEFADLVLHSDGNRSTDRFIEVHIYGPFDARAIESVHGTTPRKGKQDRADVARVKDLLAKSGCAWVEDA
jgi:hypothetical protein